MATLALLACASFALQRSTASAAQPPAITEPPLSRTVVEGQNHTFNVAATGDQPLFYQWQRNSSSLNNQTNPALGLANIQLADAGAYRVVVSNAVGVITSGVATLTVRRTNDPVYAAPNGGWAYLLTGDSAGPLSTAALDGTWNHDNGSDSWAGDGRGPGNGLAGGIGSANGILTIEDAITTGTGQTDNRRYYLTHNLLQDPGVTNSSTLLNDGVTLTFRTRLTPPAPVDPLTELTNAPNGWVNLNDGKGIFGLRQGGAGGMIISFSLNQAIEDTTSTSPTFNFGQAGLHMNNLNGNSRSLFVDPGEGGTTNLLPLDPTLFHEFWITIQDNGANPGTHRVTIYRDGSQTPAVFDVTAGTGSDVTSSDASSTNYLALGLSSTVARGAVDIDFFGYRPGIIPPAGLNDTLGFTLQPVSQTLVEGETASFNCGVTGTPPYAFQWYKSGLAINSATNSSYTTPPVARADDGAEITVVVTNGFSRITNSPPAVIHLLAPPTITIQPQSQTVTNGDAVAFSVTATSSSAISYQWRFNSANLTDATNATYAINAVTPAHAGSYDVIVRNAGGPTNSAVATLTVRTLDYGDAPPPYPTLLAANGARHVIVAGLYLGTGVDPELNGQPNAQATGDDVSGSDDEDGVSFTTSLRVGQLASVEVVASAPGQLDAWIDFNSDGHWTESGDQIFTNRTLVGGTNVLTFRVPVTAGSGSSFARFRFSTAGGLSFDGPASNGEVEDYAISISPVADLAVSATAAPDPVAVGSNLTFTITVSNLGPSAATSLVVSNVLSGAPNFVGATSSQGSCSPNGGTVVCNLSPLNNGSAATINLVVAPTSSGLVGLAASAQANESDLNLGNNSASVTATAEAPPVITVQPGSRTVTNGVNVTFSVTATGLAPLSYQWRFNGTDLASQTNATLALTSVQSANEGSYTVRVTNRVGATLSQPAVLTVLVPPAIVAQPQSRTDFAGSTATFSVTANGTEPLSYQWYFEGINAVPGGISATLVLTNVQTTQAGSYQALVSNGAGTVFSAAASLAVVEADFGDAPDPAYPTLLASNGARHRLRPGVYLGTRVDFEPDGLPGAAADGDDLNGSDDEDGVTFASSLLTGQTIGVTVVASTNGFLNAWIDFNRNGSWADAGEQVFTNRALLPGANALTLAVPVTAVNGLSFARFRFNTTGNLSFVGEAFDGEVEDYAVPIGPAVDLELTQLVQPDPVVTGSNLTYTLTLSNRGPSVASAVALSDLLPAGVTFVSALSTQGSCSQESGTVQCALGTLSAQGAAIVTITVVPSAPAILTNVASVTAAETDVVPANNASTALTVAQDYPVILLPPASQIVTNEDTISLSVLAGGTDLRYQWRFNGTNLSGATNAVLVLTNVQAANAGPYVVRVSNQVGEALSDPAILTVLMRVLITTQPSSLVVTQGDMATFQVTASGTLPLRYQWRFNGADLMGETSDTLFVPDAQPADAGAYTVLVSNDVNERLSDPATLTVLVPPHIITQPQSRSEFAGGDASFSVTATGTALSYQWYFNQTNVLAGANGATLILTNLQKSQAGSYRVVLTNAAGVLTSAVASLTVVEADFADAPAPYPTMRQDSGAYHELMAGVYLGARVDFEPDGQPNATATGDDTNGQADEDGVTFLTPLRVGQMTTVQVVASTNGFLDAWVDFDGNGSWAEFGEEIFSSRALTAGTNLLSFQVPASVLATTSYARFRFSTAGGLSFDGPAFDGEVEDYQVSISSVADVGFARVLVPEWVSVGSSFSYFFTVTNHGPSRATAVSLQDLLPAGMTFLSANASQGSCSNVAGLVTCNLGSLLPGQFASVTISAQANSTGSWTNMAALNLPDLDLDLANNSATQTTAVLVISAPMTNPGNILAQDASVGLPYPSTIQVSGFTASVYRVTVTLQRVSHEFPDDLDILLVGPGGQNVLLLSDAGGDNLIDQVTLTFDDDASVRLPDSGRINPGTYRPSNYGLTTDLFDPPAPAGPYGSALAAFRGTDPNGTWSLYVVDDNTNDVGYIENGWSLSLGTLDPLADLGVVKVDVPDPLPPGTNLFYTITLTNRGPVRATDVMVTDPLPAGLTFISATASQGGCTNEGGTIHCNLGALPVLSSATVTIVTAPTSFGRLTNTVTVQAHELDLVLTNNTATAITTVAPPVDLDVTLLAAPEPAVLEQNLTFTINLTNHEPGAATEVVLSDLLPNHVTFVSAIPSQGSCSQDNGIVTCHLGTLAPHINAAVAIVVTPHRPVVITNQASVTSAEFDYNPANDFASRAVPVVIVPAPATSSGPIIVADSGPATPYPSTVLISGVTASVFKVSVTLSNLTHPRPDDLDLLLVEPGGQAALLMSDAGGSVPANGVTLTLDDAAALFLPDGGSLSSGMFRPTAFDPASDSFPAPAPAGPYATNLAVFKGTDPNGTWSLFILDDEAANSGTLGSWSLQVLAIDPIADLAITQVAGPDPVAAGSNLTYTVGITNRGPAGATGVQFTDALAPGMILVSAASSQGSCTNENGTIRCALGTLENQSAANIVLQVVPTNAGLLTNTAMVTGNELDVHPANNTAAAVTAVETAPAITMPPASAAVTNGDSVSFSVGATGTAPLRYQWQHNGADLPGFTNASFTLPVTTTADRGTYAVRVSNRVGSVLSAAVTLRVLKYPAIIPPLNQVVAEDNSTAPLAFMAADDETPDNQLVLTAHSTNPTLVPEANVIFSGSGSSLRVTVTPAPNQFGTALIVLKVTDSDGMSASESFEIMITSVNDLPAFSPVTSQTMNEDTTLAIPFTVGDVETPASSLTLSGSSSNPALIPNARVALSGAGGNRTVTLLPLTNQSGAATITLTAFDADGGSNSVSFGLTVNPVNDAPIISAIADQTIDEDTATAVLSVTVSDVESSAASLTLSASSSNPGLVPPASIVLGGSGSARTVQVFPATNQFGTATITLRVDDGSPANNTASSSFTLTVISANDPPTISDLPDRAVAEDEIAVIPFTIGDMESDVNTLTVSAISSNLTLVPNANLVLGGTGANRTLALTPATNQSGTARIALTVTDTNGASVSRNFLLTVSPVNDSPVLSPLADQAIDEDGTLVLPFVVTDVDSPVSSLGVSAVCSNTVLVPAAQLMLSGSGTNRTLTLHPATNQFGTAVVTITVNDGAAANNLASRNFTLTVRPVNDLPRIASIPDQPALEDTALVLPVSISDLETSAASLVLTASSANPALVPNAAITLGGSGSNRTVTLLPATNQSGTAAITLTVSDADGGSNRVSFLVVVDPVNDAPTLSTVANRVISEDTSTGPISVVVGDVETPASSLTLTASSSNPALVPEANISLGGSGASRTVALTPVANQSGSATITLRVRDTEGLSATSSFVLTVTASNDPPTISDLPNVAMIGNTSLSLPIAVGDLETAAASLTLSSLSSNPALIPGANILFGGSGPNRTVTLTPLGNQMGTSTITLTVADGSGGTASDSFVLTVNPAQDPPVITGQPQSQTRSNGSSVTFSVTAAGSGSLAYQWQKNGGNIASATSANFTMPSVTTNDAGAYRAVVTNLYGSATSLVASLTVAATASAPNGLAVYLNFDNNLNAQAGTTVNGSLYPAGTTLGPRYVPGMIGSAATFTNASNAGQPNDWAVSLGSLEAIYSNSFSVSFWERSTGGSDGALLGNKDWSSSANVGWVVSVFGLENVNWNAPGGTWREVDLSPPFLDGNWHQVTLTFDRMANQVVSYIDGAAANTNNISPSGSGSFNAGFNTLVGSSGNGAYSGRGDIDDLGIWSRVLTAQEVAAIRTAGLSGLPLTSALSGGTPAISISSVPNQVANEDQPATVPFTVSAAATPAYRLTVTATSTNTTLLPNSNLLVDGVGTNRTLTAVPATNQSGTTLITLTVSDGASFNSTSFLLTVNPVNDAPTLNPITNIALIVNFANTDVPFTGISSGAANETQTLTVTAVSSNTALVTVNSVTYVAGATNGSVRLASPSNTGVGTAVVAVTVSDGLNSITRAFTVFVWPSANLMPTVSAIPDQVTPEHTPTAPIAFTVGDSVTPPALLTLSGMSSNPNLVPNASIVFGGSGSNRTVVVTPAPNQSGNAAITVFVNDTNFGMANRTFTLTVNPVNDPPTLSDIPNQAVNEDSSLGPVLFTIGDAETKADGLTVTATSSDQALAPNTNLVLVGSGTQRGLFLTPLANRSGSATITVNVSDGVNIASDTFLLTVTGVNDPPSISDIADQVTSGNPTPPIAFTVGDLETPAASLSLTGTSSNPGLVSTANIVFGGSDSNRTVQVTPTPGQSGTAVITVTVTDAENGSIGDAFALRVTVANQPPILDPIANLTLLEGAGLQTINLTGIQSGAINENQVLAVTAVSSNPGLIPDPVVNYVSANPTGTLTFTPMLASNGTATLTVTVNDGQAQSNLFSRTLTVTVKAAPVLEVPADQTTLEDTPIVVGFRVSDWETPAGSLVVVASSSNTNLVSGVALAGTSTDRTATLTPRANQWGSTLITLKVTDADGLARSNSFALVVSSANDPPTLNPIAPVSINENAGPQVVVLSGISAGPPDEHQSLVVTAHSSNPALIPDPTVNYASPNSGGTLAFTPVPGAYGTATISVTVSEWQAGNNPVTVNFTVTVKPPPVLFIERRAGQVELSFDTVPGSSYVVEYKDTLGAPVWAALSPVAGTGARLTVIDPTATGPQRFYRLREE